MTRSANIAVVASAVCVGLAALLFAWSSTSRTTALPGAGIYRENLLTGADQFCGVADTGARCIPVADVTLQPQA